MAQEGDKVERVDRRDVDRPHQRFGAALRSARVNLHLDRPEVADQAGISYPMLANIESGRRRASDDIIERLAPILGLKPERMREVRDALEADSTRFPPGTGLISYLAGRQPRFFDRADEATQDAAAPQSEVERVLSDLLVEAQRAETLALAAEPKQHATTASPRMRMTSAIIRDLAKLDSIDLAKVQGYVDGLQAARDRAHESNRKRLPPMPVPTEPFGPLDGWPVPEWLRKTPANVVPGRDMSRRVRLYRDQFGGGRISQFAHQVAGLVRHALVQIGTTDGGSWLDSNQLEEAAFIGERLARDLAVGREPGTFDPGVWRHLGRTRFYRVKPDRRAKTLDWVVRMALVATLLWPKDMDSRLEFVSRCVQGYKHELTEIDDEP